MYALMLLSVMAVVANSVWLARMNYRLYRIEVTLSLEEVPRD